MSRPTAPLGELDRIKASHLAKMRARQTELHAAFADLSGKMQSFVWEIGCGHGHFLTAYAQAHPERFCLGLDISSDRIERAQRKARHAGLANLQFLRAEARLFLNELPAACRIADVFVLFPDPWPKLRHQKHRIIQPEFLTQLANRAGEGSRLFFRTDFKPYYDDTRETFRSHPRWTLRDDPWPFEFATVFQQRAPAHYSLIAAPRRDQT